jgi:hypothetical protein
MSEHDNLHWMQCCERLTILLQNRAPEEMMHEGGNPVTEKIDGKMQNNKTHSTQLLLSGLLVSESNIACDVMQPEVYSLGNIFFKFLTNERKYDDIRTSDAQEKIIRGDPVELPAFIQKSRHPVHIALTTAMEMCLQRNASDRSTAKEVYSYLLEALSNYKALLALDHVLH